ncbi:MAG TPA: hypothetical protein PKM20_06020, partial [Nitrosomonas sp.]|nr:hypothetical protein [Nitrosomonas sp.]
RCRCSIKNMPIYHTSMPFFTPHNKHFSLWASLQPFKICSLEQFCHLLLLGINRFENIPQRPAKYKTIKNFGNNPADPVCLQGNRCGISRLIKHIKILTITGR